MKTVINLIRVEFKGKSYPPGTDFAVSDEIYDRIKKYVKPTKKDVSECVVLGDKKDINSNGIEDKETADKGDIKGNSLENLSVEQLKEKLDEMGVKYDSRAKKNGLIKLIEENLEKAE